MTDIAIRVSNLSKCDHLYDTPRDRLKQFKSEVKPRVRLSAREIEIIRATVRRLMGDDTGIRIFGSRAREDEKGGHIDLLIETEQRLPNRVTSACRLVSELQMQLGDQKIDAIIIDPA